MSYFDNSIYFGSFTVLYDDETGMPIPTHEEGACGIRQIYDENIEKNKIIHEGHIGEGVYELI